jgi:hypothetical protein
MPAYPPGWIRNQWQFDKKGDERRETSSSKMTDKPKSVIQATCASDIKICAYIVLNGGSTAAAG